MSSATPSVSATTWRFTLLAFVAALVPRFFAIAFGGSVSHDAACYYLPNARHLATDGLGAWESLTIAVPPLFPTLVALLGTIVSDLEHAALVISILASAAIVWPVASLARQFFPDRVWVERLSVLVAAAQGMGIRFAADARADALYALVFAMTCAVGVRLWRLPRWWLGVAFGGLVGIAYLLRPEALGLPLLLAVGVVTRTVALVRHGTASQWQGYARGVVVAGVVAVVALLPSLAWNMAFVHQKVGIWTLSPKAGVLLDYDKGGADPLNALNEARTQTLHEQKLSDPQAYRSFSLTEAFREYPGRMLRSMGRNFTHFFAQLVESIGYLIFVLLLAGLLVARAAAAPRTLRVIGVVLVFYALSFSVFYVSRRFWLPFFPLLIPWCAAGLGWIAGGFRAGTRPTWWLVFLLLVPGVVQGVDARSWGTHGWFDSAEERLGARVREHYGAEQPIVSAKGKVTWHAEGWHLPLPSDPLAAIEEYMRARGSQLLVIESKRTRKRRPQLLADLLTSPSFDEMDREEIDDEESLVVFRLRPR